MGPALFAVSSLMSVTIDCLPCSPFCLQQKGEKKLIQVGQGDMAKKIIMIIKNYPFFSYQSNHHDNFIYNFFFKFKGRFLLK